MLSEETHRELSALHATIAALQRKLASAESMLREHQEFEDKVVKLVKPYTGHPLNVLPGMVKKAKAWDEQMGSKKVSQ